MNAGFSPRSSWLPDEWCIGGFLSLEGVILDGQSALAHESRDERYRVVVINGRRHSDRHSLGPIQWCHSDSINAESIISSFVFDREIRSVVDEQLHDFVCALVTGAVQCRDAIFICCIDGSADVEKQLYHCDGFIL